MTGTDLPIPPARVVFDDEDIAEITNRVSDALKTGALTLGQNTQELETNFAASHHTPYAVAVSSGTAALEIALRALDVQGRDVVVPTNTFAATAFAVLGAGARPVFADIDKDTLALSVTTLSAAITSRTAAVVLVHIGGLITPEVTAIKQFCDERGVALVEDAAHAHGSSHQGTYAGSFGHVATFSFYPTKVITSGEGGMVVTADPRVRDESLVMRDQGKAGFSGNRHVRHGYAWRMSELHAAVAVVHLRRLDEFLAVRRRVADRYTSALRSQAGVTPVLPPPGGSPNYYKYVAMLDTDIEREQLKTTLREQFGVSLSGEVYELPLHRQPAFDELAPSAPLPVADEVCARHVCLPIHSDMTDNETDRVLESLQAVLAR